MENSNIKIALDIGSLSIKLVAFDGTEKIIQKKYQLIHRPLIQCLIKVLKSIQNEYKDKNCILCALSGGNSKYFSELSNKYGNRYRIYYSKFNWIDLDYHNSKRIRILKYPSQICLALLRLLEK